MAVIEAEYENGVLRPIGRLSLRPGEHVGILVVRRPDPARWDLARLAQHGSDDEASLAQQGLDDWVTELEREDKATCLPRRTHR